jgi:hypothetical protein
VGGEKAVKKGVGGWRGWVLRQTGGTGEVREYSYSRGLGGLQ